MSKFVRDPLKSLFKGINVCGYICDFSDLAPGTESSNAEKFAESLEKLISEKHIGDGAAISITLVLSFAINFNSGMFRSEPDGFRYEAVDSENGKVVEVFLEIHGQTLKLDFIQSPNSE